MLRMPKIHLQTQKAHTHSKQTNMYINLKQANLTISIHFASIVKLSKLLHSSRKFFHAQKTNVTRLKTYIYKEMKSDKCIVPN